MRKTRFMKMVVAVLVAGICLGQGAQGATEDLHSAIAASSAITGTATKVYTIQDMTDDATYGGNACQGGCQVGDYFYQIYVHTSDATYANTIGWIRKYNLSTGAVEQTSAQLNLGHGNDMTYNSKIDKLVLVHNTPVANRVEIIDPASLEIEQSYYISKNVYAIAYNEVNDEYVVGVCGSASFAILDSNFSPKGSSKDSSTYTMNSVPDSYGAQGCACDSNYIYFAWSEDSNGYGNHVVVYDWSGNFVSEISVPFTGSETYEMEYLFVKDGVIYFGTNNKTSGYSKYADLWKISL